MRRIDDIEVLRAIAVIFVVFQHIENLFPWRVLLLESIKLYIGGSFGVDLFFAVSGFVIARDLIPRLRDSPNQAKVIKIMLAFWLRRIWRLWPTAWIWLGIILIAVVTFNTSGSFGTLEANLKATYAGVFHYANIRFLQTFMISEYGVSFVYWSLSLEEQFYLLFPLMVIVFKKRIFWVLLAIILIQLVLPRSNLYFLMFRTDALALGILLAIWSSKTSWNSLQSIFSKLGRSGCFILVFLLIATMARLSGSSSVTPYYISIIALLSFLLVLMASYDSNFVMQKSRLKSSLVWIGEHSYSIYVIHIPVFFATREIFYRIYPEQMSGTTLNFVYLMFALFTLWLLSYMNFRFIEVPFRNYGTTASLRILQSQDAAIKNT